MDVKLPNGKVIKGVPDGTPKEEVKRKAIAAGIALESDFPQVTQQPVESPAVQTQEQGIPTTQSQTEPVSQQPPAQPQPYQMRQQEQQPYSYATRPEAAGQVPTQDSIGSDLLGAGEAALSIGSGAVAAPASGLAAIADLVMGGDLESASKAIEETRQALTYEPKTQQGMESQQAVAEAIAPVGEAIEDAGEYLGDATREATGSWVLGGLAQSIPEAVLELAGVKGAGRFSKVKNAVEPKPKAALSQAAPEIKQLRNNASKIYQEIKDSGVTIPKNDFLNFGVKLNNVARQSGFDPNLTPKVKGFLDRVASDYKKGNISITDLDQLRKVAQIPANAIDNATEAAIGSKLINTIDDFIDQQGMKVAERYGPDIGKKYKEARSLVSRVKKAEMIDEAVFKASQAASGFENGLRNEFRSILKNKKKRRGYTKDEIDAMRRITEGGTMENTFKRLGKLGFGADQQTNMLLGSLGFAGGFAAGGPLGAAAVPSIGFVSAKIAERLGAKNAQFAQDIVRAGKNGEEVVKAYVKNVPKRLQRPEELSALLADPSVDASTVRSLADQYKGNKQLIEDAAFMTNKLRQAQLTGALGAQALDETGQESENNQGQQP